MGLFAISFGDDYPTCKLCGRQIFTKSWIEVDGHYFHKGHFTCARCGKELSPNYYFKYDGKYYDRYCHIIETAAACDCCGKPITDEFKLVKNKRYHTDCFEKYIDVPCAFCGKQLEGTCITDFWGNRYHKSHAGTASRCDYCQRFISEELTGGGFEYGDGRMVCGLCWKSTVNTVDMINQLKKTALRYLNAFGIDVNLENVPINLIDRDKMAEKAPEFTENTQGCFLWKKQTTAEGEDVTEETAIYILDGMPEMHFVFTLAKQMMQVWMYHHAPPEIDRGLAEGSGYYAAYLVILELGGKEADYIVTGLQENTDLAHREDFFRVGRYAAENGVDGWLAYLESNTQPPW
jgi:hypothetical protein